MLLTDEIVDKLVDSIANNSGQWYLDRDLIYNNQRVFVGNFDNPESLIVHIGNAHFGVTKNTITKQQADKLSKTIVSVRDFTVKTHINSIMDQI